MRHSGKIIPKELEISEKFLATIPINVVVWKQAVMCGYLAFQRLKKIFVFEMTPEFLNRGTVYIEMDPERLRDQ